ncbi:MAG: hypothetical protein PHO10_12295 [Gemmiger sp.]|nr:hypothetical protein [Gemmiger sp.]
MSGALAVLLAALRVLGVVLLVLLGLLVVVLLLPVAVKARWQPGNCTVRVRVLCFHFTLYPPPEKKAEPAPPPAATAPPPPEAKKTVPAWQQKLMDTFRDDPLTKIRHLLAHTGAVGGWVLRHIHMRHLRVYWPVTGADAADTALWYGKLLGLCNSVWVVATNKLDIRADDLRIEPDFTGESLEKRQIACQITARPCILVAAGIYLLYKVFTDPVLRGKEG